MNINDIKVGMRIKVKSVEKLCKENHVNKIANALTFNRIGDMDKYCGKVYIVKKNI